MPESAQSSLQRIGQAQRSDPDVRCVITWMEESSTNPEWGEVSSYSTAIKSFWGQWESLKLHEGKLYRIVDNNPAQQLWKLVVPKALLKTVLEQLHDSPVGGHFGVAKALAKVREKFFWPKCRQFVEEWCRKCDTCASCKGPTKRRKGPMKQFNVRAPLERVAVDVMGPLPTSTSGNKYILILGDYFTKWVEAYLLENQQAETVAEVIVKEFVSRFGAPFQLHSDQGRNFEAELFQKMCELLGIEKTRTTALHPQSDGMVERFNRTLENHLAIFVEQNQKDWDRWIPSLLTAYRSPVHETTKQTPACLMFGRELNLPIDLLYGRPPPVPELPSVIEDYVSELQEKLEEIHQFARVRMRVASDRMKRRYDIGTSRAVFDVRDAVWLYNPKRRKGVSPKLSCDWEGPYLVLKRINELLYRVRKSANAKPWVVHRNRLWRYVGDTIDN